MLDIPDSAPPPSPEHYKDQLPKLRAKLIEAQLALKETRLSAAIIIAGIDGAGKGQVVNLLNEWLDPRGLDTHAFWVKPNEKLERPYYDRFWQALPARGRIGILFGSWYTDPIVERVHDKISNSKMDRALDRIVAFEKMLVSDGMLILKFWFHLPKPIHRKRLKDLEKHPESHWRLLPEEWVNGDLYEKFSNTAERTIRHTDVPGARWFLIDATEPLSRNLFVGKTLLKTLEHHLAHPAPGAPDTPKSSHPHSVPPPLPKEASRVLDEVDLAQSLDKPAYQKALTELQDQLGRLAWTAFRKKRACVIVFEGWDAAGKGSSIRRLTHALDARLYRVISIGPPTDEERAHHYLWRFWRQVPNPGNVTLFDRSWYGRVLVERVEGFASREEWARAYREITDFEEQLVEHGIILIKFWIHISKDEQLRRFRKREEVPYKRFKITPEDWRNREKWNEYRTAVNEMVFRTSTKTAPWTLVSGNDKRFSRIQILRTVCHRLETAL